MSFIVEEKLLQFLVEFILEWFSEKFGYRVKFVENMYIIWGMVSKFFFMIIYEEDSIEDRLIYVCVKGVFDLKMIEVQFWIVFFV